MKSCLGCLNSPRCGAKSKRTGLPCRAPGVKKADGGYGRCRIHGGLSTGPKTPEGKVRASHKKHGKYSKSTKDYKREVRDLVQQLRVEIPRLTRELKRAERTPCEPSSE